MRKRPEPRPDRKRLSDSDIEDAFLDADEALDRFTPRMAALVRERLRGITSRPEVRRTVALAAAVRCVAGGGAPPIVVDWASEAAAAAGQLPVGVQKAGGRPSVSEEDLIAEAVDAGLELGLDSVPEGVADLIDLEAARKIAHKRLSKARFRRWLNDLETARAGMTALMRRTSKPTVAQAVDADTLADSFGINDRQAATIAGEADAMVEAGESATAVRRPGRRPLEQAIDLRSEMIAHAIGTEALSAGQDAIVEQAERQGLFDEVEYVWITREDKKVCPRCRRFNRKRAKPGEPFVSRPDEHGDVEEAADVGIHPFCRCRKEVRVKVNRSTLRRLRAA